MTDTADAVAYIKIKIIDGQDIFGGAEYYQSVPESAFTSSRSHTVIRASRFVDLDPNNLPQFIKPTALRAADAAEYPGEWDFDILLDADVIALAQSAQKIHAGTSLGIVDDLMVCMRNLINVHKVHLNRFVNDYRRENPNASQVFLANEFAADNDAIDMADNCLARQERMMKFINCCIDKYGKVEHTERDIDLIAKKRAESWMKHLALLGRELAEIHYVEAARTRGDIQPNLSIPDSLDVLIKTASDQEELDKLKLFYEVQLEEHWLDDANGHIHHDEFEEKFKLWDHDHHWSHEFLKVLHEELTAPPPEEDTSGDSSQ